MQSSQRRKYLLSSSVIAGFAILVGAPAWAQDAAVEQIPAAKPAAEAEKEVEQVVVTGSRIRRNEFNSADPIQVVSAEVGRLKGVGDTGALLRTASVVSGSPQITTAISTAAVTNGGPGAQTVSLRGLGANRTLLLINGRRAGPAGTRGAVSSVDLNVIPQSIIDRVDILKDGASSVYGSDAVAGVVNIITKRNTNGIELEAYAQAPMEPGGGEFRGSASWGKTFSRGHLSVALDYYKQRAQRVGSRDYLNCGEDYRFNAATGERTDIVDPRTGRNRCVDLAYGQVWLYDGDFAGLPGRVQFDNMGNLGQFVPRYPTGKESIYPGLPANFYVVGYDDPSRTVLDSNSPFNLKSTFSPRLERSTVYADGAFQLTDNIEAYGEVLLNRRTTKSDGYRQYWTYLYSEDNGDPMSAGWTGNFAFSPTPATDRADAHEKVEYKRFVGGLRGEFKGISFLEGWNWDLFAQYSHSKGEYGQDVIVADALNSADGRSDNGSYGIGKENSLPRDTASCAGLVTPISKRNCVDVDWMSPRLLNGVLTPEEEAFLFDYEIGRTIYKQTLVEGSVSGDLFSLPAGKVGAAFGFAFRRDEIKDTPGAVTLAGNAWGSSSAGITQGDDETKEVFGELSVPLLKNMPLVENLALSLSGRYTDVKSYGSDTTYKVGLNWRVIPSVAVRGTVGTSFRAPALYELYLADQTSFPSQNSIDPCIRWGESLANGDISQTLADNCAAAGVPATHTGAGATATAYTGGGAGRLKAETSDAKTVGIVWSPRFAELNVALDYFDIQVNNEVRQLGSAAIISRCYNSTSFPTDPICDLVVRNPGSHLITDVRDYYLNVAEQKNRGLDLTVHYGQRLPWSMKLNIDAQSTWQTKDTVALFEGSTLDDNGLLGDPNWTGQLNFRLEKGDWTGFWGIDMIGKSSEAAVEPDLNASGTTRYKIHAEFTAYHSLAIQREYDNWRFLAGVANLFDEEPPAVSAAPSIGGQSGLVGRKGVSLVASQYDYIGRRAFINVSKRF